MDLWGWVIAYALVFVLLQVLVYYYLRRDANGGSVTVSVSGEGTQSNGSPTARPSYADGPLEPESESAAASASVSDEVLRCPHCGARNERDGVYTYCQQCTQRLGA